MLNLAQKENRVRQTPNQTVTFSSRSKKFTRLRTAPGKECVPVQAPVIIDLWTNSVVVYKMYRVRARFI